jgi:cell pole-organizing protein PopZ
MSDAKGQHEPSMEEILASIRRIIAEDGEQPEAASPAAVPTPASREDEILELTEVVTDDGSLSQAEDEPEEVAEEMTPPEPEPPPEVEPPPMRMATPAELPDDDERLVSDAAAAASLAALSQLNRLNEPKVEKRMSDIPLGEGQMTIEDMVREMLRPLLKEWLDSNLPHLVERVVQDEVQRLVRDLRGR